MNLLKFREEKLKTVSYNLRKVRGSLMKRYLKKPENG